jgi:hypothetical protein
MPESTDICGYFRDILSFRNYIEIPDNRDSYFCISDEELKSGVLEKNDVRTRLLDTWASQRKGDNTGSVADIILIPKVVSDMIPKYSSPRTRIQDQPWEYKRVSLLFIKATIDTVTFRLQSISGESLVWADPLVKRQQNKFYALFHRLLNALSGKTINVKAARFSLKDAPPLICGDERWGQYIGEIDRIFEKRTGKSLFDSDSLADEHGTSHNLYEEDYQGQTIVIKDDVVFAAMHIVNLLTQIEQNQDLRLPLFEKMISGCTQGKRLHRNVTGKNIGNHLGQMKNDFPLADAQRDAVHCFSSIKEGDVLAVSGPPGTGKATMLQSIVADMVVRHVTRFGMTDAGDSAPLILASSSNNKAITNIIDAFGSGDDDTSSTDLHHRWICYDSGTEERFVPMAVYCPSGSVDRRKVKEYFVTDTRGGMNYGTLRYRYYKDSSDFYVRAGAALHMKAADTGTVIKEIKRRIHDLIRDLNEIDRALKNSSTSCESILEIGERLASRYNRSFETSIADALNAKRKSRQNCAKAIDRLLDMTLRFDLYWLSVHYNECIWIQTIEKYRDRSGGIPKVYGKFLWEEIKYVCPCVVSTFYMAPKLFEYTSNRCGKTYNYGLADILIVDEAGQVSPEIGLPTFALAKKALVVGDVKQIPPVYGLPESSEETYWANRITSKRLQAAHELLSCCRSSIMAIAEDRCGYERETMDGQRAPGLFLNEHRRCVDEIISYSNELVYGGDLVPKRGRHADKCHLQDIPPIGFHQVDGNSEVKDGSRLNRNEVRAISEWLKENASRIEDAYSDGDSRKPIHELVSIITPFKAQSTLIREDRYLRGFPAGTVHTFQGAESPIVIFSLVYGKTDNPVFIKSNHELMNVAVSRAKDHFLIFGNRACLENNITDRACHLLHQKSATLN